VSSQVVSQNNHGCPEEPSSLQHAVEQLADAHVPAAKVCMNEPAMVSRTYDICNAQLSHLNDTISGTWLIMPGPQPMTSEIWAYGNFSARENVDILISA
jgi:hypothetical protein